MTPNPKYFDRLRVRARQPESARRPDAPTCQWEGCTAEATHRAPVGRMREGEYFRFCIDHVRDYNKRYNYFSGLSDTEIARFQKDAITGHRPTFKFGTGPGGQAAPDVAQARSGSARAFRMRNPGTAGLFGEAPVPRERRLKTLETRALETLGLAWPVTPETIKTRYKELVKRHHPDANGGDRASEDRFRAVVDAFRTLRQADLT